MPNINRFTVSSLSCHNNSAIMSDYILEDLNTVISQLSADVAGNFRKKTGFYPLEAYSYYSQIYEDTPLITKAGKNNTYALGFNGVDQALCLTPNNNSKIIASQNWALTFWIKFEDIAPEVQSQALDIGTFLSTRADFTDD